MEFGLHRTLHYGELVAHCLHNSLIFFGSLDQLVPESGDHGGLLLLLLPPSGQVLVVAGLLAPKLLILDLYLRLLDLKFDLFIFDGS